MIGGFASFQEGFGAGKHGVNRVGGKIGSQFAAHRVAPAEEVFKVAFFFFVKDNSFFKLEVVRSLGAVLLRERQAMVNGNGFIPFIYQPVTAVTIKVGGVFKLTTSLAALRSLNKPIFSKHLTNSGSGPLKRSGICYTVRRLKFCLVFQS